MASQKDDFQAEVLPHLDALYRTALRLTTKPDSAEDLVQETCLNAYRNFRRFTPGTNFKAWVFTILTNAFVSERRRKSKATLVGDFAGIEPTAPDEVAHLSAEDVEALGERLGDEAKAALAEMPSDYRLIFFFATVEDMKYKDLAEALGIPIGTVMSRLFRARSYLRNRFSDYARDVGVPARSSAS